MQGRNVDPARATASSRSNAPSICWRPSAAGGELGRHRARERTGLVPSTAHRLLHTLTKRGYVTQSTESGRYLLGYKVVEVASGLEHRLAAPAGGRPAAPGGHPAGDGETVNLVVLDADRVVYVDQVEGSRNVRMFTTVGTSVLVAHDRLRQGDHGDGPPEAVAALYGDREPLERLTTRTLVTIEALEDDFTRIRRRGYALNNEEHEEGVGCVAARCSTTPAARARRSACPARPRASCTRDTSELGALLIEHAGLVSEALGHRAVAGRRRAPHVARADELERAAQVRGQHGARAPGRRRGSRRSSPGARRGSRRSAGVAQQRGDDHPPLAVAQRVVEPGDDRVAGGGDEDRVELAVDGDEAVGVAGRGVLLLGAIASPSRRPRRARPVGQHLVEREPLDQHARLHHGLDLADRHGHDERAALRIEPQQALALQPQERLAHGVRLIPSASATSPSVIRSPPANVESSTRPFVKA